MKEKFEDTEQYDVVVVGAGIVGAGIFRDLTLHGVKTLLVDKKDFSSQTSSKSSKMLHGGIRYLENFDFPLVYEALHEKNLWLKLAPHLATEHPFLIPVYSDSQRPLWMIKVGLFLYDLLSGFQNSSHQIYGKNETMKLFPALNQSGLKGSGKYYDAVINDARLTLDVIYDGLCHRPSHAITHTSLIGLENQGNPDETVVRLLDELTGQKKSIKAKYVVFATGPFTDQLLGSLENFYWTPQLLPSKGSHIWLKRNAIELETPIVMTTKDGRVIFVIPSEHGILVGTTEKDIQEDESLFDLEASKEEIDYLLKNLKHYFPNSSVGQEDILSSFCGIRPLVKEKGSSDKGKTARDHKIYYPYSNTPVILGGKYTTFRTMAQDIVGPIVQALGKSYNIDLTTRPLRKNSTVRNREAQQSESNLTRDVLEKILKEEGVRTYQDLVVRRLNCPAKKHWPYQKGPKETFAPLRDLLEKYLDEVPQTDEGFDTFSY